MSLSDTWVDATFALPRDEHLPVIVRLVGGQTEKRKVIEGDWRNVTAWIKAPTKPL